MSFLTSSAKTCPNCATPALVVHPAEVACAHCELRISLQSGQAVRVTDSLVVQARLHIPTQGDDRSGPLPPARPGVTQVVIERGRAYDRALHHVIARVVERLNRRDDPQLSHDVLRASNWLAHHRLRNRTDEGPSGTLVEPALAAGYAHATMRPVDPEVPVVRWLRQELGSAGIEAPALDAFVDIFETELPGPFALLDETFAARHVALVAGPPAHVAEVPAAPRCHQLPASTDAKLNLTYELSAVAEPGDERIVGWVFATRRIWRVVVEDAAGGRLLGPVGAQRPDVFWAYQGHTEVTSDALLYSGLLPTLVDAEAPVLAAGKRVRVYVELEDGRRVAIAEDRKLGRTRGGGRRLYLQRSPS